jgi:thiol-disulfide isomerase/thioredoxin
MNQILKKSLFSMFILLLLSLSAFLIQENNSVPSVIFTTIEGKRIAMSDLKGKIVLVNFWATNCLACVTEMPALAKIYEQYKSRGLEIIAVAMPYDPPAQVLNYVRVKKLPFPVMDDGLSEITDKFANVEVTPTTYVFDKQGKLLQRTIGAIDFVKLNLILNAELFKKN